MTSFDSMNPDRLAVAKRGGWPERLDKGLQPSCGRAANPPGRVPVACSPSRREGAPPSLRSGPSGDCCARAEAWQVATAPGSGRHTSSGRFSETVGVDFFVEIFLLRKRIHARVFSGDPFRLQIAGLTHAWQRQRSDRGNEPRVGARSRAYNYATERRERDAERRIRFAAMAERRSRGGGDRGCRRMGNFPPCKALKTRKMRKESRWCAELAARAAKRAARMSKARRADPRPPTIRACSIRLERSRGSSAGWIAIANPLPRRDGEGNFPPCKALKTHKMRKESRFLSENPILSFSRSSRSLDHPQ